MKKRQIEKLAEEIAEIERRKMSRQPAVDMEMANDSERAFCFLADQRDKDVFRHGWPDFLVVDRESKGVLGVEVKANFDEVRPSQRTMFSVLEELGIMRVMIWDPARPGTLTPWRKYMDDQIKHTRSHSWSRHSVARQPAPKRVQTAEGKNEEG